MVRTVKVENYAAISEQKISDLNALIKSEERRVANGDTRSYSYLIGLKMAVKILFG